MAKVTVSVVHFVFDGKSSYKHLEPIFSDMLNELLVAIDQMPPEEEIFRMYVELNLQDIRRDRKPEGYNRKGKIRMVFPIPREENNFAKSFYLRAYGKNVEVDGIQKKFESILKDAKISFHVEREDNPDY